MSRLDRIIADICSWWRTRTLHKAVPELAQLESAEHFAVSRHISTKEIRDRRKQIMTDLLRGGDNAKI